MASAAMSCLRKRCSINSIDASTRTRHHMMAPCSLTHWRDFRRSQWGSSVRLGGPLSTFSLDGASTPEGVMLDGCIGVILDGCIGRAAGVTACGERSRRVRRGDIPVVRDMLWELAATGALAAVEAPSRQPGATASLTICNLPHVPVHIKIIRKSASIVQRSS